MNHEHQAKSLVLSPQPSTTTGPQWITITGGKGGVGKTLIAVNLAVLTSRAGYRTMLLDLDPGLANLDVHMRLAPTFTIEDLAQGSCTVEQALVHGPEGLMVLCGQSGSTRLASGDAEYLDTVLAAAYRAARGFDVVICDTGAGIGPTVLEAARRAHLTLAVTNPDPSSITDTYALCKILLSTKTAAPQLVVNRVRSREDAMRVGTRFASVCSRFLQQDMLLAGWLHHDSLVELSVSEQHPFAIHGSGRAMEDLRALTASALSNLPTIRRNRTASRTTSRRYAVSRNRR